MFDKFGSSLTGLILSAVCLFLGFTIPLIGPLFLFLAVAFFLSAIVGPFLNIKILKKDCPYCGTQINVSNRKTGVTCKACQKRVVIRNDEFVKIS